MSENQAPAEKAVKTVAEFNHVSSVLSVQSHVNYGHVGNSAAVFPLQRASFEVWPIHTVNLFNHTGYGQRRGPMIPATDVREVIKSISELGKLDDVDAVIFGYRGGSGITDVIIEAAALAKQRNPKAVCSCDSVMGSTKSGCHVLSDISPLLRDKIAPMADVITPGQFELGYLTSREIGDPEFTLVAAHVARGMGPRAILVTSVLHPERKVGEIEILAINGSDAWLVATPYLPLRHNGSGDVTAVLLADNLLRGRGIDGDLSVAPGNTTASIFELLRVTRESGSGELEPVHTQEAYIHLEQRFEVTKAA